MCWFQRYINCLFVCLLNFLPRFLPSLLSSLLMLSSLLICFLTCLLLDLSIYSFQIRSVSRLEVVGEGDQAWLYFYGLILCCSIFSCRCMFAFVVFVSVFVVLDLGFSTKQRHWLGRTSLKWPILCRVGRKTLTQSVTTLLSEGRCCLYTSCPVLSSCRLHCM